MPKDTTDELAQASRDLAHITIGLGVLAFQKAQVQRRSIERAFAAHQLDGTAPTSTDRIGQMRRALQNLRDCR